MDKKQISIIIPTYNRAALLPVAIQSVIDLNSEIWELIIIDDGSDDDTHDVVRPYLKDIRIKYYYQENTGVSAARNRGAHIAEGEYLIFLDSDDFLNSDLVSSLKEAQFHNYDIICWQVLKIIDGKRSVWKPKKLGRIYNGITASFLAGSVCYKRDIFLAVGGYDEKLNFGENYELGMRISHLQNLRMKIINKLLLFNIVNTLNRTSNSLENRLDSYFHMYEKHVHRYRKDRISDFEMNYLIGYVLEKSNKLVAAKKFYKKSWLRAPWQPKPFLKLIYFALLPDRYLIDNQEDSED